MLGELGLIERAEVGRGDADRPRERRGRGGRTAVVGEEIPGPGAESEQDQEAEELEHGEGGEWRVTGDGVRG